MKKVGHSIWIPSDLDVLVRNHADALGLGYTNVVIDALHRMFGLARDPLNDLMQSLRIWLLRKYSRTEFPPDIMLEVFQHIQADKTLRGKYEQCLDDGSAKGRAALNRRIGQAVAQILDAKVINRKVTAKNCPLIQAYSRLAPKDDS